MELQTIEAPTHRRPPDKHLTPAEIDVEVGRRLRVYRVIAGVSQQRLGELVGVTFQQIQKYERASNRISAGRLVRLAEVLGVRPAALLPGSPGAEDFPNPLPNLEAARAVSTITDPVHLRAVIQLAEQLGQSCYPAGRRGGSEASATGCQEVA
ncbi:helix-turn-helix transcriptional regulator [Fodinicurvata sp. EGI_FJ10296]|uniref:helix-turn-helix domain-containing protein n=1 Tax=Fodinicurvata sp. EGI_FJ10296 TaxID=3231908 RepID=UPI0034539381